MKEALNMRAPIKFLTSLAIGITAISSFAYAENPNLRPASTADRVSSGIVLGAGMAGAGGMVGMAISGGSARGAYVGIAVGGVMGAAMGSASAAESVSERDLKQSDIEANDE
jgi:hypothetical protein